MKKILNSISNSEKQNKKRDYFNEMRSNPLPTPHLLSEYVEKGLDPITGKLNT